MGFGLWTAGDQGWAQGTSEYDAMDVAVIEAGNAAAPAWKARHDRRGGDAVGAASAG